MIILIQALHFQLVQPSPPAREGDIQSSEEAWPSWTRENQGESQWESDGRG